MKKRLKCKRCPICENIYCLDYIDEPIQHWGCVKCNSVFVIDKEGIIGVLNIDVLYKTEERREQ